MKTNIEITAVRETGLLGKIAVHMINKGFRINRQTVADLDDEKLSLMSFDIESQQGISSADVGQVKAAFPGIVLVKIKSDTGFDARDLPDES